MFKKGPYFSKIKGEKDFSIVLYKSIDYDKMPQGSAMYPFYWLKNGNERIWKIGNAANVVVELTTENGIDYNVQVKELPKKETSKFIITAVDYLKKVFKY